MMDTKLIVTIACVSTICALTILSILYVKYGKKQPHEKFSWAEAFDSFGRKKFIYITYIGLLNGLFSVLVYMYADLKVTFAVIILMKAKDVIMTLMQTIYYSVVFVASLCKKKDKQEFQVKGSTVSIVPVYSETKEQVHQTITSIIKNVKKPINNLVCVICDGKDIGIGDILTVLTEDTLEYVSWKDQTINMSVTYGKVDNVPCMVMLKMQNQGKRDSLIVAHDLFNYPRTNLKSSSMSMRKQVRTKLTDLFGLKDFSYMFCTDADTIIADNSFSYLYETLEARNAVACCGLVTVDFSEGAWSFWNIFQNFQYLYGQYVRRATESLYGKVTCLPGCITMFKVHPSASDAIAMYSELPGKNDMLKSIVQLLGTDRRLTNSFLFQNKSVITVFDPRAKCFTVPPGECYPYLTQRRRWGSNAYFNTMCIIFAPNTYLITRFFAFIDYLRMSLMFFRIFNTVLFLYELVVNFSWYSIIPCSIIILYPISFFFVIALFDSFLRSMTFKLILGYMYNRLASPMLSIMVFTNLFWNMGSTCWGANQQTVPSVVASPKLPMPPISLEEVVIEPKVKVEDPPRG